MATWLRRLIAASLAISGMVASEFHGTVNSGGLPFPGVTVTAIQGDRKVVTTTDEKGFFRFAELADGIGTVAVEMLGFEKIGRRVGIAPGAPAPVWELKFLSEDALLAVLDSTAAPDRTHGGQPGPAVPPSHEAEKASDVRHRGAARARGPALARGREGFQCAAARHAVSGARRPVCQRHPADFTASSRLPALGPQPIRRRSRFGD